jgi:hypothetical protein
MVAWGSARRAPYVSRRREAKDDGGAEPLGNYRLGGSFSSGSEKGLFVEPFVQYRHK